MKTYWLLGRNSDEKVGENPKCVFSDITENDLKKSQILDTGKNGSDTRSLYSPVTFEDVAHSQGSIHSLKQSSTNMNNLNVGHERHGINNSPSKSTKGPGGEVDKIIKNAIHKDDNAKETVSSRSQTCMIL